MDVIEAEEGTTRFFVPRQDSGHAFPPGTGRIFYNRRMELNRDATVLLASVLNPREYLDAMGATGARGIRVASECGIPVTINDRDPEAVELIRKNAALADLQVEVTGMNIHTLLSCRRFDAVDLDPFGSPAPFCDSAIRGTLRYLMVTATDTAPLCGAHKKAGIRRYFAHPVNTEYHAETGLRTLLGFVVREAVKYDRGIRPLFCFSREHYVRAHFLLENGAGRADTAVARIGYIHQCTGCPDRTEQHGILPVCGPCRSCGSPTVPIGPLWLGPVQDPGILAAMLDRLPDHVLNTGRELGSLLHTLRDELPTSSFYDYHVLAKRGKVSPPPIDEVIAGIRDAGFRAGRTHYSGTGIRTDAPWQLIMSVLTGE
ncbi:MAG: tRNA (guanine(10)-N(2))-dimethyltransferase [Methanomicrobiales archaeon]|nr:tRNA (guanine(10)-N(2))-dimethyltransferase [Methanomicrobiales archaeon]NYT21073.1 tRNA (guanine(10)-N(2))-dimethyltransferase [Methanomicrobiales archaeon]